MWVSIMEKFEVTGGKKLEGIIKNQGAKNAALPIAVAALLTDEEVVLKNVPHVSDIENLAEVLKAAGAKIHYGSAVRINASGVCSSNITAKAARRIRASVLIPPALISRFPNTRIIAPGGDCLGTRKMDAYIMGLKSLGARVAVSKGSICLGVEKVKGTDIELNFPSVTGTEGTIIASTLAEGKTVITNAAREPEVVDLSNFLNSMGAKIKGAGTDMIKVTGVKHLNGTEYSIIPDRIAAGTLMVAAAITRGNLLIENVIPQHLRAVIQRLRKSGVDIFEYENEIRVDCMSISVKATDITTRVYPGFPTDMQPIFMALMMSANGTSRIKETLYDGRFGHVEDLRKMGASIEIDADTAIVRGVKEIKGTRIIARDIRSGAALALAGLDASGMTEISNVYQIDRGYEGLETTLSGVGAEIKRVKWSGD